MLYLPCAAPQIYRFYFEPVVLECKLYTTSLADSLANMEQLISSDDFKIEPIDLRGSAWQIEHRNGKNYQVAVFRKLLLYPLRAGELRIGDLYMDVYIRRYNCFRFHIHKF